MIARLCFALYATDASDTALAEVCIDLDRPTAYDAAQCPGEVVTYTEGAAYVAVCEVTQ